MTQPVIGPGLRQLFDGVADTSEKEHLAQVKVPSGRYDYMVEICRKHGIDMVTDKDE